MKRYFFTYIVLILLISLANPIFAYSGFSKLRCGKELVSVGDSSYVVQKKCGEPISVNVVGADKRGKTRQSADEDGAVKSGSFQSKERLIEEWTTCVDFGYSSYCYVHVLTFKGGKLVNIENTYEKIRK